MIAVIENQTKYFETISTRNFHPSATCLAATESEKQLFSEEVSV